MIAETKKKVQMVEELCDIFYRYIPGIRRVSYKVFTTDREAFFEDKACIKREYVVVEFEGGAMNVRNCSGDSCGCIVGEIAKMLSGGYYDELREYNDLVMNSTWEEVSRELKKL